MAITPPGADPLARIRALVGNGADPIPTPMTDPDEGLVQAPMADIGALPSPAVVAQQPTTLQFDPTIDAPIGLIDEVEGVPEVDMSSIAAPIAAGVVSVQEQEDQKWVQLHNVPPEMAPMVSRMAIETGITPESLVEEGRPWSDAFPAEEIESIEKQAESIKALKTGLMDVQRAPGHLLDIERVPAVETVAEAVEQMPPTEPVIERPRDIRWREYDRRLSNFYDFLKANKMGPPNKRQFGVVTYWDLDPQTRADWPEDAVGPWNNEARAEWKVLAGDKSFMGTLAEGQQKFPFTHARDVPKDLLGPAFTDDALEKRFEAEKEEYRAKRLGDDYYDPQRYAETDHPRTWGRGVPSAGRRPKGTVTQAEFDEMEVPRVVLNRAATDSEVTNAVAKLYEDEKADHKRKKRYRTEDPSWKQQRLDSAYEDNLARRQRKEEENARLWHQSRRNVVTPPAPLEPTEPGGATHAEIIAEYEAAEGDPGKQKRILNKYPRFKPGAPLTSEGVQFEKEVATLTPQATAVFRKLKRSRRKADQLVYFGMFGTAPTEHIHAVIGRAPDGSGKIDYEVDPEVAAAYLAPTGPETPEQKEARVNKILSAFTRKRFLEHHPDYIIQRQESIADLRLGAKKISLVDMRVPEQPPDIGVSGPVGDLKRVPGQPVAIGDLRDPSLPLDDVRKDVLVSEIDVGEVRHTLIKGEDPELLRTAATVGFTKQSVGRAFSAQLSDDSKISSTIKSRNLDRKVVERVFSEVDTLVDTLGLVDAAATGRLFDDGYIEGTLTGQPTPLREFTQLTDEDKRRHLSELRDEVVGLYETVRASEANAAAVMLGQRVYAHKVPGDEPTPDYTAVFENLEDSLFRGRHLYAPEHIVYDPTGIDDTSFMDHYNFYTGSDGLTLTGDEAREAFHADSTVEVNLGLDAAPAFFDFQLQPQAVNVEELAGEMLGHARYFPKHLARHNINKAAMFNTPFVMAFAVGLPLAQAVYDIPNESILNPSSPQDVLKKQVIDTLRYSFARAQPAVLGSANLLNYKTTIETREERELTEEQAMNRWEINRIKWASKYKQIIMEGFLPQHQRSGIRAEIQTSRDAQHTAVVNFLRYTELVPLDMWLRAHPSERWRNNRNQRRLPVTREILEFLRPATAGYRERASHVKLIKGYNFLELQKNKAWDPNMGTIFAVNWPVTEDVVRRGSTATPFMEPGLIDLDVASQFKDQTSYVGATVLALGHEEHPHYRGQNLQGITNTLHRNTTDSIVYDELINLVENRETSGIMDLLKVHLPHSINNMVRGTWGLGVEGLDLASEILSVPVAYTAAGVAWLADKGMQGAAAIAAGGGGLSDEEKVERYMEKVELPGGKIGYRVKVDEQGRPLLDAKSAMRLKTTDFTFAAALKEVGDDNLEEAHRKVFVTIPNAVTDMAHFYIDTFSDWDKFKAYVKTDPAGAFLDVIGGYSLLGKKFVPGSMLTGQRVRKIDQRVARIKQAIRTRPHGKTPQDVIKGLSELDREIIKGDIIEQVDRGVTLNIEGQPVHVEIRTLEDVGQRAVPVPGDPSFEGPRKYTREGSPIDPFGYKNSQITELAGPADWFSLREIPHRYLAFIEDIVHDGTAVRIASGLTDSDLNTRYSSTLMVAADTAKLLDHSVPILGPIVNRSSQLAVEAAASGSRFGMVASYFMNRDSYAGSDLRVMLLAGEQDVATITSTSHHSMVKTMDALGRRLVDVNRTPSIRTLLRHTTKTAVDEAVGKRGTSLIKLRSSKRKLRVTHEQVEKYIIANYEEFGRVLDDIWKDKVVDPDTFTVDVGDGNYLNLEDLGLVDRKGKPTKKLKELKGDQAEKGRKVLSLVFQEMMKADSRIKGSPAARSTNLHGITKVVDGRRVNINVLQEDFINVMDSEVMADWAFKVFNEYSAKGHLDDLMEGGSNPFIVYFRVAEVEKSLKAAKGPTKVERVGGPAEPIPLRETVVDDAAIAVVDDAAIAVRDAYVDVVFREVKDGRRAPVGQTEINGRKTIVIDEKRVLSEWTPDNEKIKGGNSFHGPTAEVRFASPGEYLDFVIETARAKVAIKKKPKQTVAGHRADYTEAALKSFREKRQGLPDVGRVTGPDGRPLRHEMVTGETKTAVRGGQVVGFDLKDLGLVRRNGRRWVLSDAGDYVFSTALDALRVRAPGGVATPMGLSEVATQVFQLVSDGKRGLFAVSNKRRTTARRGGVDVDIAPVAATEIAPGKVGTGGTLGGDYVGGRADALAFSEIARATGLKPTVAVTSTKLLESIKTVFDEDLIVKETGDFINGDSVSVTRKDRPVYALYRRNEKGVVVPLEESALTRAIAKFDLDDADATLKALQDMGLTEEKLIIARKKDQLLEAYDFRDSAIGRLVGNAGNSPAHLRKVVKALSDELGRSRSQNVLEGKLGDEFRRRPGQGIDRELEASLRITEEANLERMRNNPLAAVQGSMMALTHEQRMAWLSWMKHGELPDVVKGRPDILRAWEKVGLVDIGKDGAPRLSPLGALSSMFVVDHAKSFYKTMLTRAIVKDAQMFSGPTGSLFFNAKNYLPSELAALSDLLQGTLTDVQAGLALDWAEHINLMGLEHSTAGTKNMLTHQTRVYEGTFEKYLRGGDLTQYLEKSISKRSVMRDRSYAELVDAQARRGMVMADMSPHEAAMFARVEMRHNMHRARTYKKLLSEGRIQVGAVTAAGDYIAPGLAADWVHLNLEDMKVMDAPMDMGKVAGSVLEGRVPTAPEAAAVVTTVTGATLGTGKKIADTATAPVKAVGEVIGEKAGLKRLEGASESELRRRRARMETVEELQTKSESELRRRRARMEAVEELQTKKAARLDDNDLHYIFGDLAQSKDKLFIRRTDAGVMSLEDRVQHAWARQILDEQAALGVPPNVWDKVAAKTVMGLEGIYEVADFVHKHPLTKVFKVRKLMMSALGPASRNIQANTMLTFMLHPEAILSPTWWQGLNEYMKNYRTGVRPVGAAGDFMDHVSSMGLIQSGLLNEIGFQDYTRLNVGVDKWLSDIKRRMDDYVVTLKEGEKAVSAALYASQELAIGTRQMLMDGALDGGALRRSAEAVKPGAPLAKQPKQSIIQEILNSDDALRRREAKVGVGKQAVQVARETREALAPLPFESISAENRYLRAAKNAFNHTDEGFKYAYLKYLYEVKGMRGMRLKDELYKHWPDYGAVADWERMYTLQNSFGVYETKMYQLMTRFIVEHPLRARTLGLANEMMMASMLSDPETYESWLKLPGYKRMSTRRYPFGWLDEGGFNVMSADRFEVESFNNPVFQLFLALTGNSDFWAFGKMPKSAGAKGWLHNLIQTATEISYGSVQLNPAEFAMNVWDNLADYGSLNDLDLKYGKDEMTFGRALKNAWMQSGGPRWNAIWHAAAEEPYPTGSDKPDQSVLSSLAGAFFGSRVIEEDKFIQENISRRSLGEAVGVLKRLQGQLNALERVIKHRGEVPVHSAKFREQRQNLIDSAKQVILDMDSVVEAQGGTPQILKVLKVTKMIRDRALRTGAPLAPQFQGREGELKLQRMHDAARLMDRKRANREKREQLRKAEKDRKDYYQNLKDQVK